MYQLAIDVMGGDNAPASIIEGLSRKFPTSPEFCFHLYGDKSQILPLLEQHGLPTEEDPRLTIHHTDKAISDEEKPATAMRNSAGTSMRLAIEAVNSGTCHAVVSAGNTGAYMALCKVILKTLPGIDRPALVGLLPSAKEECVMLDVGANIGSTPEQLMQFSIFGRAYATCVLDRTNPTVGLLNIGTEDMKGNDVLREAKALMDKKMSKESFIGFVEGNDVFENKADVVVTDGFNGNIAIKSAEGVIRLMRNHLRSKLYTSLFSKIAAWFMSKAIRSLEKKLDPRSYNGAPMLGLKKLAVKSHGGADAKAFANCLKIAMRLVKRDLITRIEESLKNDL